MSTGAVIMLVLAILIVWGGLAASIVALSRHPDQPDDHTP
ncbi:MAG TPA: methionine/alanine import family NSS transporter small subunit [Jiangellaceae bacterium]